MSRRRQIPWIHRRSRYLIAAIAILGAINTAYLTSTKLFGGETACPSGGCEQVLSSSYATVFGLPLALFGFLAYLSMTGFALAPLAVNPDKNKQLRSNLENWTWLLLFAGATAMLVFSGYLMYVMISQFIVPNGIESICYYCVASAVFATALFGLTLAGRSWDDFGQLLLTGIIVSMVVLVGTLGLYANASGSSTTASTPGEVGPPITTTSGQAELALARHLRDVGARMYGAYWCPHCQEQKQLFGQQAARVFTYIECAPDGQNSQTALCEANAAQVTGYPTWELDGQFYSGTQSLEQLADLSGYQGSRNFRN